MNQQNLYLIPPTVVALLLQYSGSRIVHRDEFSSCKRLTLKLKMANLLWILGFHKNRGCLMFGN